jgi:hypothetical protein
MKALLFFALLSPVIASDPSCQGRVNHFDMIIPKDAKVENARSIAIYFHWQQPQGLQAGKPDPIACDSQPFSSIAYVSDYLNTSYVGDTLYLEPMNYFESFYPLVSKGIEEADVGNMKWRASKFVVDTNPGKIKSFALEVSTKGSM